MEGRATTRIPYASKFASRLREKAYSALCRCSARSALTPCAVRPMGRDRLAQGLISIHLNESGNGEAEAHRLGDGDENREGPCTVVDEAYKQQVEEATGMLSEGPKKGFYKSRLA